MLRRRGSFCSRCSQYAAFSALLLISVSRASAQSNAFEQPGEPLEANPANLPSQAGPAFLFKPLKPGARGASYYSITERQRLRWLIINTLAPPHSVEEPEEPSTPAAEAQQNGNTSPPPSQAESQDGKEGGENKQNAASDEDEKSKVKKSDVTRGKQTKRMLYVVPNFGAVSANTQLPPLTTKGKFWLATQDSFDYSSFVWTGIIAGQQFGLNSSPEFGHGMAGYGRYYWHNFVDGVSATYFTEAIVPTISHQDPRYYTLGSGNPLRRLYYALSRVVVTKTDSGGTSFNWSEVGGNALAAGLANAYYPPQERTGRQTLINWGSQIESAALNNIAKEFWPDFRHYVLRKD